MIIKKVLNNNVVTTVDEISKLEKVIMGSGIAFQKRPGDLINVNKIQKVFTIENENDNLKFQKLLNEIPLEYVRISEDIISHAKETLKVDLSEHIHVSLTDHIAFAIKRYEQGIKIKNHLLWEIQKIHKKEYAIGVWSINYIEKELGIKMEDDEAGFIATHFVYASMGESMDNTINITNIIQEVLNIIKYSFTIELDINDLSYDRLVTHLKFFAQRVLSQKQLNDDGGPFVELVQESYGDAYKCALKIKSYMKKNYNYHIDDGEIVYLSLHIQRIISSSKIKNNQ
ncbi:MAG: PRD domain-containing protein [Bacillota bacterium]|nr:PRD domain-containing protein [Bacillota bacterium]